MSNDEVRGDDERGGKGPGRGQGKRKCPLEGMKTDQGHDRCLLCPSAWMGEREDGEDGQCWAKCHQENHDLPGRRSSRIPRGSLIPLDSH